MRQTLVRHMLDAAFPVPSERMMMFLEPISKLPTAVDPI
jgi:hypothetical protein